MLVGRRTSDVHPGKDTVRGLEAEVRILHTSFNKSSGQLPGSCNPPYMGQEAAQLVGAWVSRSILFPILSFPGCSMPSSIRHVRGWK